MLRVISLLPSSTEMLARVLEHQAVGRLGKVILVGRSHECDYPPAFVKGVPILTRQKTHFDATSSNPAKDIDDQVRQALASGNSLYDLDVDLLQSLSPDIILTQSLCDVCSIDLVTVERVVKRMKIPATVIDLNPHTLTEVIQDIGRVGEAIGCEQGAAKVVSELNSRIAAVVERASSIKQNPNVAFIEWTDPIYVGGHWTPEIIHLAGGTHPLNKPGGKSFALKDEIVSVSDPDLLIIAPCGMPLDKTRELVGHIRGDAKRRDWFDGLRPVKNSNVALVDGNEMFNRPGPRLVDALEFCSDIINAYAFGSTIQEKSLVKNDKFPWEPL